jgi:DNA-binding NtrC family response regulator
MSNATVLVVDDEPLIRWSLVSRLRDEGVRTLEAATAADAVAQHGEGADLVLLDVGLPDASGLSVLTQLKYADPDTLVIMLTAETGVDAAVEAMKHGAFHYATKPFDLDEVMLVVSKALETTHLQREVRTLRGRRNRTDRRASSVRARPRCASASS